MDIRELSGLDLAGAKSLLLAFATDAKRLDKEIAAAGEEKKLWTSRVALAQGKGMAELAAAATAKLAELESRIQSLEGERASMQHDLSQLKEAIPGISAKERSIDPDRLLAEIQLVTGELLQPEAAAAEAEIGRIESAAGVEDALAALKKKMGGPDATHGDNSGSQA